MNRFHINIAKKSIIANKFMRLLKENSITNKKYYFSVAISSYINNNNICIAKIHAPTDEEISSYKQITTYVSLKEDLYEDFIRYCELCQLDTTRAVILALEHSIEIIPSNEREVVYSDHEISKSIVAQTNTFSNSDVKIEFKTSKTENKPVLDAKPITNTTKAKKTILEPSTSAIEDFSKNNNTPKSKKSSGTKKSQAAMLGLDMD